jgi:multiple sugar transport system permease protein
MRSERTLSSVLWHAFLIAGAFVMLYPLLWLLGNSFEESVVVIMRSRSIFPQTFSLANYAAGLKGFFRVSFLVFFGNSFYLVAMIVLGTVASTSFTAFAFARLSFRFQKVLFALMLATIMLPFHAVLIPQYVMFHRLGWVGSYLPLIVPRFFATSGFFIFLNVQFMRGIPAEFDNAAYVDGCTPFGVYFRIILPLSVPALITATIFSFIWSWNDFFSHLLYISDVTRYTVSLGLRLFLDSQSESAWGSMLAMSVLSLLPVFAMFVLMQRYLIEGVTAGGVKG